MKIEILLHHVSQDQRAQSGESPYFGWMHGPSSGGSGGGDKTKPKPKENQPQPSEPRENEETSEDDQKRKGQETPPSNTRWTSNYVLRPEPWGGVLISMNTQRVYAADEQAFELLSRLSIDERLDLILAAFDHEQGAADRLMEALRAYVPANELVNS